MRTRTRIEVMHGVNLDQLGRRNPEHYGGINFDRLEQRILEFARELGLTTHFFQTNSESEFVEHLHRIHEMSDGIVVNPGAWTHYSYAIRDAIEAAMVPVIETHISNVHAREEFRHHSVISPIARGIIVGFGVAGYSLAIRGLYELHEAEVSKNLKPGVRT